jgi:putative DNA primase/helicase
MPGAKVKSEIVATYDYRDAGGDLIFQAVRMKPKSFRQRRPDPDGKNGWTWNLKDVAPFPYRLPELLAASPEEPVFLAEGEKDADRLAKSGLIASTNPMGAGKWRESYSAHFKGRDVVILPDNDQFGREHAEAVARSLYQLARSVKVIELPDLAEKGDVSDWLDRGHTIADLRARASEAPTWTPTRSKTDSEPPIIPIRGPAESQVDPRFNLTDLGNAERLVYRHGEDLRYCHIWTGSGWLVWDRRRWAIDNTAEVRRRAKKTVRAIYKEAALEADDDRRKALGKWAFLSEKRDRLAAMISMAEFQEGVPVLPEQMDLDPWSFNCNSGTIDLHTGQLRPHHRGDMITKLCPVDYDPDAKCPLWESTLRLFFKDDHQLIDYWQRIAGYAMAGKVRDHIMPVAYGSGSNGKSTILGTLLDVFGSDYAMKCPPDMLMAKKSDSHPTDRADLFGKRLVVAIETESGRQLNETMVKELTGGDKIRARRMRENFWEFQPSHTLIMATNHKPVIRGTDNGIWRRLRLVPFSVTVAGGQDDKDMPDKLKAEFPGILAWCVRGCLRWQSEGLQEPKVVSDATAKYRLEQDILGAFLEEHTMKNIQFQVRAKTLFEEFSKWAMAANEYVPSMRAFGQMIEERGIEKRVSNGTWYQGIGLHANQADHEEGEL